MSLVQRTQWTRTTGDGAPTGDGELGPEFARLLSQLGVEEKPSRVLAFLAVEGEGRSAEIEQNCSMRQPEVSQATKALRDRGWIVAAREKRPGKGRPVNNYSLKVSVADIVNEVEALRREEINQDLARIERLRTIADALDGG